MSVDRLEELLAHADAALPPARPARSLAQRVRARAARRARVQLIAATLASLVIAGVLMHVLRPRTQVLSQDRSTPAAFDVRKVRAELAALDAEATLHQRAADDLAAALRRTEPLRRSQAQLLLAPDPLAHLQEARDRAARILVIDGDRLRGAPGNEPRVQAAYRRAVELFPETAAAHEAFERLKAGGA